MLSYNEEKSSKVEENIYERLQTKAYSWIISDSSNTLVHMMNNDTVPRFGKLRWTVLRGSVCNKDQNESLDLMLTRCHIGNFTCNNGQCIPFEKRCNGMNDCEDESDEEDCKILVTMDKIGCKSDKITGFHGNLPKVCVCLLNLQSQVPKCGDIQ